MLWTLIEKELKNIITGPKFTITFLISAILILMSIWIGVQEYQAAEKQYAAGMQLTQQKTSETSSWIFFQHKFIENRIPYRFLMPASVMTLAASQSCALLNR